MILTITSAAQYLDMNEEVLRRKARAGEIPAKKEGGWRFLKDDLDAWIRSGYHPRWRSLAGAGKEVAWHSKSEVPSGGLTSPHQAANELDTLLEQVTQGRRRNTTTR